MQILRFESISVWLAVWHMNFLVFSARRFLSSAAHQFLRSRKRLLNNFEKYGILTSAEKLDTGYMRFNSDALSLVNFSR